jgi:hypothetical protein
LFIDHDLDMVFIISVWYIIFFYFFLVCWMWSSVLSLCVMRTFRNPGWINGMSCRDFVFSWVKLKCFETFSLCKIISLINYIAWVNDLEFILESGFLTIWFHLIQLVNSYLNFNYLATTLFINVHIRKLYKNLQNKTIKIYKNKLTKNSTME